MKHLTVYYKPPEDITVQIDEIPRDFTWQVMMQLLKPTWHILPDNTSYNKPAGPFRKCGASYVERDPATQKQVTIYTDDPTFIIDYDLMDIKTIQSILKQRFDGLKPYLVDPDVEIDFVPIVPPQ
jgi:hypothetical protein